MANFSPPEPQINPQAVPAFQKESLAARTLPEVRFGTPALDAATADLADGGAGEPAAAAGGAGAAEAGNLVRNAGRKQRERGGDKLAILPFTGEISYLCFTGSQKYF